jgi:hypothetical protein
LTRSQLARRLGSSGRTVAAYLDDYEDAPKPDADRRYSFADVKAHIARHSARLGSTPTMLKMKERLLALRVSEAERAEAVAAGQYILAKDIEPQVAKVCSELTRNLQAVFEGELPSRYIGRSVVECRELNANGVDRVIAAMKSGLAPITPPEAAAAQAPDMDTRGKVEGNT